MGKIYPSVNFLRGAILTDQSNKCKFLIRSLIVNAQGLQSAFSELKFSLTSSTEDIVGACETFLSATTPLTMLDLPGMKCI